MSGSPFENLDAARRYLRTLYAVERAHSLGDEDDLQHILASVDPVDLAQIADWLSVFALVHTSAPEPSPLPPASPMGDATGAGGAPRHSSGAVLHAIGPMKARCE